MDLTSPLPFRHQREAIMPKPLEIPVRVVPHTPTEEDIRPHPTARATGKLSQLPSFVPVYLPPRQPLPPHKLANIANALGVNMPMPASYRSPSPSGSSSGRAPSRFLLHVVPPAFLPSDDEYDDRPDPTTSSVSIASYRSQFRRGTLIPLHPTLSSQLGAIAREFNLPSTGGLVLYLVHSSSQGGAGDGPRISEEIWKLLWYKALQAERQESHPRSASTLTFRSGRSTPSSPLNNSGKDDFQPLKTVTRTVTGSTFPYPSPSTSSAPSSEIHLPLAEKDSLTANSELLAAISSDLTPNPFLPILAKVEFDIDRRKATWYEGWTRGRRERSRWRSASDGRFPLNLPERAQSQSKSRFMRSRSTSDEDSSRSEYTMLDDGEGDKTAIDEDAELLDQTTVRLPNHTNDPLSDVFGSDGSTWSELRGGSQTGRRPDLIFAPVSDPDEEPNIRDEDEVLQLWEKNKRPKLPSLPRKGAPPPLKLAPNGVKSSPTKGPQSASDFFDERKSKRRTGMVFGEFEFNIVTEPEEMMEEERHSGDRSSQVIMKQKLDQLEKQLAHLSPRKLSSSPPPVPPVPEFNPDVALRSAPPGIDKFAHSNSGSPLRHTKSTRSTNDSRSDDPSRNSLRKDSMSALKPQRGQEHRGGQGSQSSSGSSNNPATAEQAAPHSAPVPTQSTHLALPSSSPSGQRLNGRLADRAPSHLTVGRSSTTDLPRVQQIAGGQDVLLPPLPVVEKGPNSPVIPLSPDPFGKAPPENLRHTRGESASTGNRPPSRADGTTLPAAVPEHPEADDARSRFSADSEQGVESLSKQRRVRSNSIMSVRSLRNLWRKSNASGKNGLPPPPPTPTQTQMVVPPPLPSPHPNAISFQAQQESLRHSRTESRTSVRSSRAATVTERSRRPSATTRPDSGSDPFQFDNANIYKSASSSSLPASSVLQHAASGSISQSKGILKGWQGNTSPSDPEAKRLRQPPFRRTESVASVTVSERSTGTASVNLSERSSDPSSPPSSPRGPQRLSKHKPPSMDPHPVFMSQSVPAASAMSLSRYPDTLSPTVARSSQSQSFLSFEDGTTPRVAEFEMIPREITY